MSYDDDNLTESDDLEMNDDMLDDLGEDISDDFDFGEDDPENDFH
jgi:hypothetical protein